MERGGQTAALIVLGSAIATLLKWDARNNWHAEHLISQGQLVVVMLVGDRPYIFDPEKVCEVCVCASVCVHVSMFVLPSHSSIGVGSS